MQYANKLKFIITSGCAFYLSACTMLVPEYKRPLSPIPSEWNDIVSKKPNTASLEDNKVFIMPWKEIILDEQLRHVIEIALKQSRSLREAVANIESAKATYNVQHASEFPIINAVLSGNRGNTLSSPSTTQNYSATVGISSYELDLFGKAHNLSTAEYEKYLSSQESQRSLRITLISEIVTAWLTLASDKNLLELSKSTEVSAKKTLDLMQRKVDLGASSALDLYEAQTLYYQAQADIAKYKTKVGQDKNAINLLAGETIDDKWLPESLDMNKKYLAEVPTNMTSGVLLNRPDILAAEHDLKSANANIGVARAAYFPSISITTEGGLVSTALSSLFSGGATSIWSFMPNLTLPIFDLGVRKSKLDYTKAQKDYYIAAYELAIQTAFKEVADALARRQTIEDQLNAQNKLVQASKNSYTISNLRYKSGIDTYLNALIAQRTFYTSQQTLLSVQLEEMTNRITLYRALGGSEE
ncbi:MAG: efflux transporter outer membrane subunit [Sulfurovaceae bacterium]|nr:efflux transporter outer membrane subunit [Sulfurovaceae bacterium]